MPYIHSVSSRLESCNTNMYLTNVSRFDVCLNKTVVGEKYLFSSSKINSFNLTSLPLTFEDRSPSCHLTYDDLNLKNVKFQDIYTGVGLIKVQLDNICLIKTFKGEERVIVGSPYIKFPYMKKTVIRLCGYSLSLFLHCLSVSHKYVDLILNHLPIVKHAYYLNRSMTSRLSIVKINVVDPEKHVIDLKWAKMACTTVHERRMLQYAMSWLSTLGGAFSALGEEQERCARVAGKISVEQLRIAMKLGDEIIIMQCKLYFSLSLIQRGHCKRAKKIILEQYNSLKNRFVVDKKTMNMCKGIWARLKYELFLKRSSSISLRS